MRGTICKGRGHHLHWERLAWLWESLTWHWDGSGRGCHQVRGAGRQQHRLCQWAVVTADAKTCKPTHMHMAACRRQHISPPISTGGTAVLLRLQCHRDYDLYRHVRIGDGMRIAVPIQCVRPAGCPTMHQHTDDCFCNTRAAGRLCEYRLGIDRRYENRIPSCKTAAAGTGRCRDSHACRCNP